MTRAPMRKIATVFLASTAPWIVGAAITANAQSLTFSVPITLSALSCTNGFALTGTFPNQTLACAPTSTPAGSAPSGCQLTPNPPSLSAAGLVQLTVACGGGGDPTSYSWSATPAVTFKPTTTPAGPSNSAQVTQNTLFTVTASNAGGASVANVNVQIVNNSNTNGEIASSCAAKGFTTIQDYEWDWAKGGLTIYTDGNGTNIRNAKGPIGSNGIVVIKFKPTTTAFGATGSIMIAPSPGDLLGATRTVSISTTACDLDQPFPSGRTGYDTGIQFTVGEFVPRLYPPLVAEKTYYINIASRDASGTSTCGTAGRACDMVIQASRP